MLTGMIVFIVIILFFVFFVFYKRDMLMKMFALNAAAPAGEFQQELEKAADAAIRRLEQQIGHLELLLDEADAKIAQLDEKLQAADRQLASTAANALPPAPPPRMLDVRLPAEPPPEASVAAAAPIPEVTQPREAPGADRRRLIIAMAEQGYSVTEIAKTTGTGKGEIMLLLQLNKK